MLTTSRWSWWTLLGIILFCICGRPACGAEAPFCELYAVGHFGNFYEVAGKNQMRGVMQEARHWGFNRYSDWFDTLDCVSPFTKDPQYSLGHALWDLKKTHFKTAQELGMVTYLVI